MNCKYCGQRTDLLTSLDQPICLLCAQEKHFSLCTEIGKYIADASFTCDLNCKDCINKQ